MRPKHSDCYDGAFTRKTGIKRRKKGVWRMRNRTDFGAKYCCEVCLYVCNVCKTLFNHASLGQLYSWFPRGASH